MDTKIYSKNKKNLIQSMLIYASIAVAIGIVLVVVMENGMLGAQSSELLIQIGFNIILAVSLNLVCGFLGELTLGHAAFMSIGGYIGSLITVNLADRDVNWLPAVLIALVVGGVVAAVLGLLFRLAVLQLSGDYLAIVTLAFGEIVKSIVNTLDITGGTSGLKNYNIFTGTDHYLFVYIVVALSVIIMSNIRKTRLGRGIRAVRDNAIAAEATGLHVNKIRVITFVISAFFAGIAGVIYANSTVIIKPQQFDYNMSIQILLFAVLGGLGNLKGSIAAVIILTVLPEALRSLADVRMLVYSIVLIALMIFNNSKLRTRIMESPFVTKFTKRTKKEA